MTKKNLSSEKHNSEFKYNQKLFKFLTDNSFDIISLLDNEGRIMFESKAAQRILGYSLEENKGKKIFNYIHPNDVDYVLKEFYTRDKSIKTLQYRFRHKKGYWVWLQSTGQNFLHNPEIKGIIVNSRDITEHKKAQEKLKESEKKFKTIFENSPVMIDSFDDNGNCILWNKACQNILGWSKEELNSMDNPLKACYTDKNEIEKVMEALKRCDGKFREYKVKTKSGKMRYQMWADFKNNDNFKISFGYDITELKNVEKKLKEANATKNKFLSIISHDLRSPFNGLIGITNLILENFDDFTKKEKLKYLVFLKQSVVKTYFLLEDLLLWAKSQSGKIPYKTEKIELEKIVLKVISENKNQANDKKIEINFDISEKIFLNADKNMLKTILRNLLSNAVKFTNEKGKIVISAKKENKNVLISVSDTGIGIEKENFRKLWQISESYTRKGTKNETGTGLGLILCKEFVEKHNGKIWVESKVNKGSTFYFTIPIMP